MPGKGKAPPENPTIHYFDACVFLSVINNVKDRIPAIRALFMEAEKGEIRIYTSVLSQAEVAFAEEEKAKGKLDKTVEEAINKLWHPNSPIHLIEVYSQVVKDAMQLNRELLSTRKKTLGGADSIHLATARKVGANIFNTYDTALLKLKGIEEMKIIAPESNSLEFEE